MSTTTFNNQPQAVITPNENDTDPIVALFNAQQQNQFALRLTSASERIEKLKKLKAAIEVNNSGIIDALQKDLRKNSFETSVFEIYIVLGEIDFAIKNLSAWMTPVSVPSNLMNLTTRCSIRYEPKGVCLIISPWNYPFQLLMSPLVSAIAAGNCCILKPSELAPATSNIIAKIIRETYAENEIAVVEGGVEVSNTLLSQPFNHIFFTGSTRIGKVVMQAASKHLASVTLELGGKSPVIVDTKVNLKKAATKIAWGKLANAGQTCIAPDYVFVHESQVKEFIEHYKQATEKKYFSKGQINKEDYCKIVSEGHFTRLKNLVEDAVKKGGKIEIGGTFEDTDRTIHPTVLTGVSEDAAIMQEEIFGPLLPIVPYKTLDEAIRYINAHDKPLALYIFSKNQRNINVIVQQTSAGGTCINDVLIHLANPHLPFGGVNTSGIGGSHGFFGFKVFSHERSVMQQNNWFDVGKIVYPPYKGKGFIMKILKKLM